MGPREVVLEQIAHHETPVVPYSLPLEPVIWERLDEHYRGQEWRERITTYLTWCGSPVAAPSESIDDAHYRDAFGAVWRRDGEVPAVVTPALASPSFDGYDFPSIEAHINAEAKEAARKRVAESPGTFTLLAVAPCLWESWYVRGFGETLMDCVAEEDFYCELLDRLTDLCLAVVDECADIPADAIMMGDDWGDQRGVLIGPERWRRFHKPRYARIFEAIHDQGKLAVLHCCGSVAEIMGDIVEIGLDVLESVQPEAAGMNPYELKQRWGDRITFWGGLGSQSTIPFATPDELRKEIRRLRREMSKGGGYILAPAKPVRIETPTENAVALVEEFLLT